MIALESVANRFEEHLTHDENNRILLSGRFGIGKTYFLNEFFDKRKDKFNKILISPVNYVISSNEDVFELIKADIVQELFLTGKVKLEKLPKDNKVQSVSSFIENNPLYLLRFMNKLLSKINPVAKIADEVLEELNKLYKKFNEYKSAKAILEKTVTEDAFEFVEDFENKMGNVYENNYITKVINGFLKDLKKGSKQNVLIIDDLDRIDPEHIFRILNILSAHNNHYRYK